MDIHIKQICLWIKEYKHVLRIVGGILFFLAFIAGLFWVFGQDVESVAFILSLLSSLFFASPSIAEYFLPERKPIKNMTFQEILEFIPTTDPKKDWHGISKDWSSEWFLKEDPRLRFRAKYVDDGIQNEDFKDEWANCHLHPHATGYWHELYYDGAFLDRIILVAVDGARAHIPPPEFESKKISFYNYQVAKIHDSQDTLDEYISKSKLEVEDL
nr:hypothetical protein [uncultured Desulfobacter sp.]